VSWNIVQDTDIFRMEEQA